MKTKEQITEKIQNIQGKILGDVLSGLYTDRLLQEYTDWVDALNWVLQDGEEMS